MPSQSDLSNEVAEVYTRLIERDSPEAAKVLQTMQRKEGAHAAFRAALVITVLKRQVQDDHFLPDLKEYAYLFRDYPETTQLMEEAIAHCLLTWGLSDVSVSLLTGNAPRELE